MLDDIYPSVHVLPYGQVFPPGPSPLTSRWDCPGELRPAIFCHSTYISTLALIWLIVEKRTPSVPRQLLVEYPSPLNPGLVIALP